MELSLYDTIVIAYRGRLLTHSDAEFRKLVGVSMETIRDRRTDEKAMAGYYHILSEECIRQCDKSLYTVARSFIMASCACCEIGFDWKERRQLASRKKFCRWLFRRAVAPGHRLGVEEELRFSPKDCDEDLLDRFYPDGIEEEPDIDLTFALLITFGVVRPIKSVAARSRDISEADAIRSANAMINLISILRDDIPQMGVLPSPLAFDVVTRTLQQYARADFEDFTPAVAWGLLRAVEKSCVSVSSPQKGTESELTATGLSMPGIWVDDADDGTSRFWVFPENKLMAFCYKLKDGCWSLIPYEFVVLKEKGGDDFTETCVFVTPAGNRQILSGGSGMMQQSETVCASYEYYRDNDEFDLFSTISFVVESGERPEWMDWNSFTRLSRSDLRHNVFMQSLSDIYDPASPIHFLFNNVAPFMTDVLDSLIGMDNNFLYISDRPAPDGQRLICDEEDGERFWYDPLFRSVRQTANLRNVVISEEHPLYVVPRFTRRDLPMPKRQLSFVEAVENTDMESQITIYHTPQHPEGILCFNRFSLLFPLDDKAAELRSYGVKRLTDRGQFFQ